MKRIFFVLLFPISIYGQSLKSSLEKQDYNGVIQILKDSLKNNPKSAALYCDMGHYYHYRAYDSRPLIGYNEHYSDSVLFFLNKAISLDPSYRDSYYWLHAEYGARVCNAMVNKQKLKCEQEFREAIKCGAMPKWLLEFARNSLSSCDSNAIVFTYGDLSWNSFLCIQFLEKYRTDISVIPLGLIGRPEFVKLYRDGFEDIIKPVKIRLSDNQIMDIRPYKWDTLSIKIKIPLEAKQKYNLDYDYFNWTLLPDMVSEGDTYLSPFNAILAEIIEANQFERSVYFSDGYREEALAGLLPYTINCGIVKKLVPFKTKGTPFEIDSEKFEKILFNKSSYHDFNDIDTHYFPDKSQILLNYYTSFWQLSSYYQKHGINKNDQIREFLKENVSSKVLGTDDFLKWIKD